MGNEQADRLMKNVKNNERGFASLVIALIMIIVLSLLTVGFAQLARREQQNALDKQLAVQANYASESGINDAYQAIVSGSITDSTPNVNTNTCLGAPLTNKIIDPSSEVSYSCVLVSLKLPNLVYNGVSPGAGQDVSFSTTGTLDSFTVHWASIDGKTTPHPGPSGEFTPVSSWNSPAVLQFSITPLADMSRNGLINNSFTVYLYPGGGSGTVAYGSGQGQIVGGNCNGAGPYPCAVTINNLGVAAVANESYLIHIVNYYDISNISFDTAVSTTGTALEFTDGQAQIDATGKAKNVLKRLQVRVPIKQQAPLPAYAAEGQDICKRFSAYPGTTSPDPLPGCSLN